MMPRVSKRGLCESSIKRVLKKTSSLQFAWVLLFGSSQRILFHKLTWHTLRHCHCRPHADNLDAPIESRPNGRPI